LTQVTASVILAIQYPPWAAVDVASRRGARVVLLLFGSDTGLDRDLPVSDRLLQLPEVLLCLVGIHLGELL
jgi:hypothetical protein